MNCNKRIKTKNKPCKYYIRSDKKEPGFCGLPDQFRCVEAMKKMLPSLSHSSRMDWADCKMKYYYRQIEGIEVRKEALPEPIKMGAILDGMVELIYDEIGNIWPDYLRAFSDKYQISDIQFAKLYGLIRAFIDLEVKIITDNLLGCQYQINQISGNINAIGFIDRAYQDYFVETKLTGRPDYYKNIHSISNQVGTYFLSNPDFKHCIMEITRTPGLKLKKDEELDAYQERIYQDVISRPSYYFQGYNRKEKTFGVKFWRKEFDLDNIQKAYNWIEQEIRDTIKRNSWYPNYNACHVPGQCFYYPICSTGVISEQIYKRKKRGGR